MLRLSVAIADTAALPNTFVVFRGFESSIRKAAALGFGGVELAVKTADDVDRAKSRQWLEESGLQVSCISTGQVYAGLGLSFTDPDPVRRRRIRDIFIGLIELAEEFGQLINIGRARGPIGAAPRDEAESRFIEMARDLCDGAAQRNVTLVIEPVNRYELDFINTLAEGVDLIGKVDRRNLKLMPDVFHMNIEDSSIEGELIRHIDQIAYIHFADSNRLAPGWGHLDFPRLIAALERAGYRGWAAVEILPKPDPDSAARQAVQFLQPIIKSLETRRK
jgi:sugar phosphate isomerase/epimerase